MRRTAPGAYVEAIHRIAWMTVPQLNLLNPRFVHNLQDLEDVIGDDLDKIESDDADEKSDA